MNKMLRLRRLVVMLGIFFAADLLGAANPPGTASPQIKTEFSEEVDSPFGQATRIEFSRDDSVPNISVRTFLLKLDKVLSSRVPGYVFSIQAGPERLAKDPLLRPGAILLLKRAEEPSEIAAPIMALRLLKVSPEQDSVIAQRVRLYKGFRSVEAGDSFIAFAKVGEKRKSSEIHIKARSNQ